MADEKAASSAAPKAATSEAKKAVETAKKEANDAEMTLTEFTGDVPETAITNAMTALPGFPARKADGELVDIVHKTATATNTKTKLIDADGNEYQEDANGLLVEYEDDVLNTDNVQAPYGMTQKAAEKAMELQKEAAAA